MKNQSGYGTGGDESTSLVQDRGEVGPTSVRSTSTFDQVKNHVRSECGIFQVCAMLMLAIITVLSFLSMASSGFYFNVRDDVFRIMNIQKGIASVLGLRTDEPDREPPTLVVFMVVDQLRADEVTKYRKRFTKNGFNYFFKNGIFFRNANYRHMNTFTGVGHATLHTGGSSATHGIVGNNWINYRTGKEVEVVTNLNYTEVDKLENITGTAPTNLLSTTIGDEIRLFTNESKIFSISGKDRAAILPGGHLGKSFYYGKKTGRFISSTFYYPEHSYPDYVSDWNSQHKADEYHSRKWELKYPLEQYHYQDRKYIPEKPFSRDFPKSYNEPKPQFYADLLQSPVVDALTVDFAKTLVVNEELGKKKGRVDMLAMSLSNLDYVQHHNGVNTLEAEDLIYKIDEYIEDFLAFLDAQVGLDNCLLVLTADHGVDLNWKKYRDMGFDSGRLNSANVVEPLNAYLNSTLNLTHSVVLDYFPPNLYLDRSAIAQQGFALNDIERMSVEFLEENNDLVYYAFSRRNVMEGLVPRTPVVQKVHRAYHPKRSGEVIVIGAVNAVPSSYGDNAHGTAWCYGKDISKGLVSDRAVGPEDIAPTVLSFLGLKPPTGSMGTALTEVLAAHEVFTEMN